MTPKLMNDPVVNPSKDRKLPGFTTLIQSLHLEEDKLLYQQNHPCCLATYGQVKTGVNRNAGPQERKPELQFVCLS